MDTTFWHDRWASNKIGFHRSAVNPLLEAHWASLGIVPASKVLVPLCGKSYDMVWLEEQGCAVVGAELSPVAVRDFFVEQDRQPAHQPRCQEPLPTT